MGCQKLFPHIFTWETVLTAAPSVSPLTRIRDPNSSFDMSNAASVKVNQTEESALDMNADSRVVLKFAVEKPKP